jgi:hypothetical protein
MAMVQKLFHELPENERNDFESACARHGFVGEDFDVSAEEGLSPSSGSSHIPRKVTVVRVIGGDAQAYLAATDNAWTVAFERDLERGDFGYPLAD